MKAFVLDSDSWHFKLANYGERRIWSDEETDICEYTRAVIKGFFTLFAVGIFFAFVAAMVGGTVYNIYDMIVNGARVEPWTIFTVSIISGIAVAAGIIAFREWNDERTRNMPEPEPGFVKLAYRKFKDKTCARIEFKTKE